MKEIADYDTINYDYSTYWKNREYEHSSEVLLLNKLLKDTEGGWFLDIGGSFGRLLPTYYDKFSHPVIVDYSLKTLQINSSKIKKDFPNTILIAANAYSLPFRESSFDGCLMVRVLHHINEPNKVFKEIFRILNNDSIYIQEFANKLHIKAFIKAILTLNFDLLNTKPYQQPERGYSEGARKNVKIPFLNYHTKRIKQVLAKDGFTIKKKMGCSFLRLDFLKKRFSTKILLQVENVLQNTLSFLNLSPSIFLKSTPNKTGSRKKYSSIEQLIVCPKCKGGLEFSNNRARCKKCNLEFKQNENIWDFRV
jgi:ubiquinone/menaquinone biosynthesis C-methylase UbiE